jgi:hypothetical protein
VGVRHPLAASALCALRPSRLGNLPIRHLTGLGVLPNHRMFPFDAE